MPTAGQDVRIGIWGATGSGKTMFLVVLRDAGLKKQWKIVPDPASHQFTMESTDALKRGQFQTGTVEESKYSFSMGYDVETTVEEGMIFKKKRIVKRHQAFKLVVHDYPGVAFQNSSETFDKIGDFLASCDGILYLFDPTLEQTAEGNGFYFDGPLLRMEQATPDEKRQSGRLPTWIAVCVTKYDEIEILEKLKNSGHIVRHGGPLPGAPVVSPPSSAFRLLASESIPDQLDTHFLPGRIAYFGTSAIGFYSKDGQRVAEDDSYNLVHTLNGARLRGPHRPINVLEPLEWLINSIYSTRP